MKAFWCAALTLAVLVGAIVCYSLALNDFATELEDALSALPQTIDAAKRADKAQTQQILDRLLERVKENELLIHLAVPYERLESLHEKLIQLREAFRTEHYEDFCVARALCLEEIEILKDFESITLPNLV